MDINRQNLDTFFRGISAVFRGAMVTNVPDQYLQFATIVPSSSARNDYTWLGEAEELREWIGGRVLTQLASHDYNVKNRKFERTLRAQADDLRDDVIGIYSARTQMLADAAKLWPNKLCFEALVSNGLCFDKQNYFDTDHPVGMDAAITVVSNDNPNGGNVGAYFYLLDTTKPLKPIIFQRREDVSFDSLTDTSSDHVFKFDEFLYGARARGNYGYGFWQQAMRSKTGSTVAELRTELTDLRLRMRSMKNDQGRELGIDPDLIICGRSKHDVLTQAVDSQFVDTAYTPNPVYKAFRIICAPWLP